RVCVDSRDPGQSLSQAGRPRVAVRYRPTKSARRCREGPEVRHPPRRWGRRPLAGVGRTVHVRGQSLLSDGTAQEERAVRAKAFISKAYFLEENPFPTEAIVRWGDPDPRSNGALFSEEVFRAEYEETVGKFIVNPIDTGSKFHFLW